MDLTFRMPAPDEDTRFASTAFDHALNQPISVRLAIGGTIEGTLTAATVADDGRSVELTLDLPVDDAAFSVITGDHA